MAERFFRLSFQRFLKICWTDQLDRPSGQTSWTDQLDRSAGQTSSFYLKPWPVRIFEDFPFSLYIVAASESDEGLVLHSEKFTTFLSYFEQLWMMLEHFKWTWLQLYWKHAHSHDVKTSWNIVQINFPSQFRYILQYSVNMSSK